MADHEPIEDFEPSIALELTILASDKAEIHQVGIGIGLMPSVVIKSELNDAGDGVVFRVITGSPYDSDESHAVGSLLAMLGETIASDNFQENWKQKVADEDARIAALDALSEDDEEIDAYDDDDEDG